MTRAETIRDVIVERIDATGFRAHGLHVLCGEASAQWSWFEDVRREIHSLAKGVCVLVAGIATDEGLIDVDEPIASYLPSATFGAGTDRVTLRHLLAMTSGVAFAWSPTMMTDWPDLAVEFLSRPSRGRVFEYSGASTYTAMRVLAARVGDVGVFAQRRLFEPLGIMDAAWRRSASGAVLAAEGLALRTEEIARIGRLIRDRGVWRGHRVVSAPWVDAMHSEWTPALDAPGYRHYALAGWDGPGDAWRLHGANGQLLIFRDDTVVTITAEDHVAADALAAFVVESALRMPN